MSKIVIHSGQFVSKNDVIYQVDIWKLIADETGTPGVTNIGGDSEEEETTPQELTFPADEPVVIEWEERSKEEVICGSAATIRIESMTDRAYIDLYAEEPGTIGVDIYKGVFSVGHGSAVAAPTMSLYWSGTLDTEQYEEPYERLQNYDVTLTFTDFGIFERLKFNLKGIQTLQAIISDTLTRSQLSHLTLDTSLISSYHPVPSVAVSQQQSPTPIKATPSTLAVNSDNFYDEDGEPLTLAEVIQGILQPLAQRIIQRAGTIYIYDLNAIATIAMADIGQGTTPHTTPVNWSADTQTLAVDRIYNSVRITFSPYTKPNLLTEEQVQYTDPVDETETNLTNNHADNTGMWSFYPDYNSEWGQYGSSDRSGISFTIHKGHGTGLQPAHDYDYFRIVPQGDGSDAKGIVWMFMTGGHGSLHTGTPKRVGYVPQYTGVTILKTERVFLPPIHELEDTTPWAGQAGTSATRPYASRWMLRLKQEILADPRYNPFTNKGANNEDGNYDAIKDYCNILYQPANIRIYDSPTGGNVTHHYSNRTVAAKKTHTTARIYLRDTLGFWVDGDNEHTVAKAGCWLAWYNQDADNRNQDTGICGWKANRHCIGADFGHLAQELKTIDDGQYIPYPPNGGWLEIELLSGVASIDKESDLAQNGGEYYLERCNLDDFEHCLDRLRWLLYKAPILDIVDNSYMHNIAQTDDIEFSAEINTLAKENLDIETICGTIPQDNTPYYNKPSALGTLYINIPQVPYADPSVPYVAVSQQQSSSQPSQSSSQSSPSTPADLGRSANPYIRLSQLTRAANTDTPENLLIATLFSQFAQRHTVLSGEADIINTPLLPLTEQNQTNKFFIITADIQDLIQDTSDLTITELSPDTFTPA